MNAQQLIEIASVKGYAIGRNRPGEYRYGWVENGSQIEKSFVGKWNEFVKFVKTLPRIG